MSPEDKEKIEAAARRAHSKTAPFVFKVVMDHIEANDKPTNDKLAKDND